MKRILTLAKKAILGLLILMAVVATGLVFYYHAIYKTTPLPEAISVEPLIKSVTTQSDRPVLYPIPKKVEWQNGNFNLPATILFNASPEDKEAIKSMLKNRLEKEAITQTSGSFKMIRNDNLEAQEYHLSIQPNTIRIEYKDLPGLYYALTTVKQLAKPSKHKISCVNIEDKPDLATRGVLLDISRGKVPTLNTLYGIVDFLSDLKYNHLELYIEGFSFAYPSFKQLWEKTETPLTPEEIKQLDTYCKERFIELVPNQNSLGHMDAWLATDQYKPLAECPDGYKFMGLINMKTTLAPSNPQSLELVTKMSDDLLPNFSSDKFNVNLDEPFELGKNKDHPIHDQKEITKIYLDYAKRLNTYVKSKGKSMLMWGDVISRNPEFAAEIPKDITLLEWRYESFQDFAQVCKKYKEAGLHYMVCPGTSTWTDFTGLTDNMLANVENAVTNGIQYGAEGMLITDWGNTPHLQYLTVSYSGLAYGAALSWNNDVPHRKDELSTYLSRVVFNDETNHMGEIVLALGRYSQFEEYPMLAGSITGWAYRFGIMEKTMTDAIFKKFQTGIFELLPLEEDVKKTLTERFNHPKIYDPQAIIHYVDTLEKEMIQTRLQQPDSALILDEYKNAIRMIRLGAKLKQYNNYHLQQSDAENRQLLTEMNSLCKVIVPEHERLWMSRNKRSGYNQSIDSFKKLQIQIEENLALLDKNILVKWGNRTKEKIITAAGVLFLK